MEMTLYILVRLKTSVHDMQYAVAGPTADYRELEIRRSGLQNPANYAILSRSAPLDNEWKIVTT